MIGRIVPAIGLVPACGGAPPERDIVGEAAAAMGGLARIEDVSGLAIEGEGTVYALGQNRTLDSELLNWRVSDYRREIDFAWQRWREQRSRPIRARGPRPTRWIW